MATRMSKKTTVTTTTSQKGSSSSGGMSTPVQSPGSRNRPPSPTSISRIQEKDELAGLNDRLATYIDRVRQLENENSRLTRQITSTESTVQVEVVKIKQLYESELTDARKLLDEISKEKTKLQLEVQKYKDDAEAWEKKYRRRDLDAKSAEKKLLAAEAQVNDLQTRLNDAINQRKYWEDEYNRIRVEIASLEKQLEKCKKQLEDETVARVDLENRNQSLIEELAFKNQVHSEELRERRTKEIVIEQQMESEYEDKLTAAVRQMREENDEMIRRTRVETEELFEAKLRELTHTASRYDEEAETARKDLLYARKRIDELSALNAKLSGDVAMVSQLRQRIEDLERSLRDERNDHQSQIEARDREIRKLREQLAERWIEYQDLLDTKIQLDNEIATYRKLLESEETRLSLSMEGTPPRKGGKRGTPVRATPTGSRKRKRMMVGTDSGVSYAQMSSRAAYATQSGGRGDLVIQEFNEEGKFVKILNNTDKELAVGGYQVKHAAGDKDNTYKFHRTLHIKPHETVTVWSSDADETHAPPSTLVMRNQKWHTGDEMRTVIINSDGEEEAYLEMKKDTAMQSRTYYTSSLESDDSGEGDPSRRERECFLM